MAEISVSAFAADFFHMERDLEVARENGADSIHVDVMDGHFVPLFGFSQPWIRQMLAWDARCGDVHLMAGLEEGIPEDFLKLPLQRLTIHIEAAAPERLKTYLGQIREAGMEAGLAAAPWTKPEELEPFFPYADEILLMSCSPGTEGAAFREDIYGRIRYVRALLEKEKRSCRIAVDGGLNEERALACIGCGAGRVIIGRAFFTSEDKKGMAARVREASFREEKGV